MAGIIEMRVDMGNAQRELGELIASVQRPRVLMAGISAELVSETEQQFKAEGDPKWQALATSTIESRTKKGTWPGMILQASPAGLAASVQGDHTESAAYIGAGAGKSAAYAAIQHFGGKAGRGRKVTIPSRPYMPFHKSGSDVQLTARAEKAILNMAVKFIENGRLK